MAEVQDWNTKIIEEFRANDGRIGGQFEGAPVLLLHSTGARSGKARLNPMMYQARRRFVRGVRLEGRHAANPDWYHNLVAHPDAEIEVGSETKRVRAPLPSTTSAKGYGRPRRRVIRALPITSAEPPGRSRS